MRITRQHHVICLDHERQIDLLATEYGVTDCKSTLTPMATHLDLVKLTTPPPAYVPFRQLVGALIWVARQTHHEITQPVVYLALLCTCFGKDHFLAALRKLKYLLTVKDKKLAFWGGHDHPLLDGLRSGGVYTQTAHRCCLLQ